MGDSGFKELADVTGAFDINEEWLASDLTFEETTDGFTREIQIQISTGAAATIQMTLDGGTFTPINNNVTIFGYATFTILVKKDSQLNFRNIDVNALAVRIIIGG